MPSYDDEVLDDGPLAYYKLDEPEGSTVAIDSSGNGLHGSFVSDPDTPLVYGVAGPVETDSPNVGMSGGVARAPEDSSLDVVNAFTLEIWVFNSEAPTAGTAVLFTRTNSGAGTNGTHVRISGQTVTAAIRIDSSGATVWDVTWGNSLPWGTWFHVAVTRNGNVLRLYGNGVLRDERTDLPTDTVTMPEANWGISANPTGENAASSWGVARATIYDAQLNAGRIRAHYEAALASLPASATITVRVVVELDVGQEDATPFPFLPNMAEPLSGNPRPITEHLSYATNVLQSEPDYQQRINAQPHHVERTLEYFVTASERAKAMLDAALWTPGQTYKLPIAKDWGTLTAAANTNDSTLSLDTTLKDYEINSYVVAFGNVYEPWTAQFFQITTRTDGQLGITPNVAEPLPIGSTVMPARLAILPDDELSLDSHLIDRETAALQFEILSTELSTRRLAEYTPTETYLGLEVFDLERVKVEWLDPTEYQVRRRQQGAGNPTGNDYQRAIDTGSPQTIPLRVLLTSRASQAEFYGWMDARQGKVNPVWIVSEENDLNVIATDGAFIVIDYIGYTELYNVHSARRHIAFKKADGSVVYKMITAAVNNGDGTETLSVSSPPLLADIVKTSFMRLCTAPDQFELVHYRDGAGFITQCEFVMTELLTTPEPG